MEERTLPRYPAGKRELIFGLLVLLFGTFTWNSILYGGFCLGFAHPAVSLDAGPDDCRHMADLGRWQVPA